MSRRWVPVALLLAVGWLLSPQVVPLYDGVSFPQEPYRFVPARGTAPATPAQASLPATGGVNTGGQLINSAERGPQVQIYAPPRAFQVASTTGAVLIRAEPIALEGTTTPSEPYSDVYRLTITSSGGPVRIDPNAQPMQVTLRAAVHTQPSTMYFRPGPRDQWRSLRTRSLGHASFNANAQGPGDYVLVRGGSGPAAGSATRVTVIVVIGLLLVSLTAGVAMAARRRRARQ